MWRLTTATLLCSASATAAIETNSVDDNNFVASATAEHEQAYASALAPTLGFQPNIVFILTDDMDTRLSGFNDTYSTFGGSFFINAKKSFVVSVVVVVVVVVLLDIVIMMWWFCY